MDFVRFGHFGATREIKKVSQAFRETPAKTITWESFQSKVFCDHYYYSEEVLEQFVYYHSETEFY